MTIRNITSVVIAAVAVITLASCGTSRSYPNYPERRDYPGRPYPVVVRSYPVYPVPPGHVRKAYKYKRWDDHDRRNNNHGKSYKKKSYRKY